MRSKIEKIFPKKEKGWGRFLAGTVLVTFLLVAAGGVVTAGVVNWQEKKAAEWKIVKEKLDVGAEKKAQERLAREKAEQERLALEEGRQERLGKCKLVALTFDDGPSSSTTEDLLDILRAKAVRATFFVIGNKARNLPEIVRREVREGHEVGSHTMTHMNFSKVKNGAEVRGDAAEFRAVYREIVGAEPKIMRPPYGNGIRKGVVTDNVGFPMIHWSVDTLDWKYKDAESVRELALEGVYDGAIILMHDIHPTTVEAVPAIIDDLREMGYEFVTIPELAKIRGVELVDGKTHFYFKP